MLSLGAAIKHLRRVAGLSQEELATRAGVTATYLSHVERNRKDPSLPLLRKLAASMDVPPGVLLAVALWAELPEENRDGYAALLGQLLELSSPGQLRLPVE